MKKIVYILLFLFILSCSENPFRSGNSKKIRVEGKVVETFYSERVVFSVRPLPSVNLLIGATVVTETGNDGRYRIHIEKPGEYILFAQKSDYLSKSMRLDLLSGVYRERDFHLERLHEEPHGWWTFPATGDGGRVAITGEGLCIFSGGRDHVYATKTISVPNNRHYTFVANLRKDPATELIYWGVHPQIEGYNWKEDIYNINGWRKSEISYTINDTTVVDIDYIYDEEGNIIDVIYIYPETVEVVIKIGVQLGTNYPTGFFQEIRWE